MARFDAPPPSQTVYPTASSSRPISAALMVWRGGGSFSPRNMQKHEQHPAERKRAYMPYGGGKAFNTYADGKISGHNDVQGKVRQKEVICEHHSR